MIKYAIELEKEKYLESDQFIDSETYESPMTKNIEEAVLYDELGEAEDMNKYKKEDGYNSKVVKVEITFTVVE